MINRADQSVLQRPLIRAKIAPDMAAALHTDLRARLAPPEGQSQ